MELGGHNMGDAYKLQEIGGLGQIFRVTWCHKLFELTKARTAEGWTGHPVTLSQLNLRSKNNHQTDQTTHVVYLTYPHHLAYFYHLVCLFHAHGPPIRLLTTRTRRPMATES